MVKEHDEVRELHTRICELETDNHELGDEIADLKEQVNELQLEKLVAKSNVTDLIATLDDIRNIAHSAINS